MTAVEKCLVHDGKWGHEIKGQKQTKCFVCKRWRYPHEQAECGEFKPMYQRKAKAKKHNPADTEQVGNKQQTSADHPE